MALPVGQVRFERSGESWEIHYGLDARFRGRGIGVSLLRTALKTVKAENSSRSTDFLAGSSRRIDHLEIFSESWDFPRSRLVPS